MVSITRAVLMRALLGTYCLLAVLWPWREAAAQTAVKAVGPVSEVWAKDERYARYHAYLTKKMSGVPELEKFTENEQWVTVLSTTQLLIMPGIHKGRSDAGLKLQVGDVVEMKLASEKGASAYQDMSSVVRVLCRVAAGDYKSCADANPAGLWDEAGKAVQVKRR